MPTWKAMGILSSWLIYILGNNIAINAYMYIGIYGCDFSIETKSLICERNRRQIKKMPSEEALHQPWLWNAIGSCVSRDRLRHATGQEYLFEWDVNVLTERDHFQRLKPYVLLSSSHKDIVCLQKTWNATQLVCDTFILLFYG